MLSAFNSIYSKHRQKSMAIPASAGSLVMIETTFSSFQESMAAEVEKCVQCHAPLRVICHEGKSFIVVSEDDWRAIEATIYINQFPGLVESIHEANSESIADGVKFEEMEW